MDIGTTSLKAAFITAHGEVVSFCSVPIEDSLNTASLWYGAFFQAVCELKGQCALAGKSIGTVDKIVISGNGPTVVSDDGYTVFWNEDFSDIKIPDDAEGCTLNSPTCRKLVEKSARALCCGIGPMLARNTSTFLPVLAM